MKKLIHEYIKIPRYEFNLNNLENFYHKLKEAEDSLRKTELIKNPEHYEREIDSYNSIRNDILNHGRREVFRSNIF